MKERKEKKKTGDLLHDHSFPLSLSLSRHITVNSAYKRVRNKEESPVSSFSLSNAMLHFLLVQTIDVHQYIYKYIVDVWKIESRLLRSFMWQ